MTRPPFRELSVVIASRNSWADLERCLPSLASAAGAPEVIVIDNGSADGTLTRLRALRPDVVAISNPVNRGHCCAINQGLRAASGEFVMVLDADTVLWPEAVDRLVGFLRDRPDVAIVAPRMLNPDGSIQETARTFPRPINAIFGRRTTLTRWFPQNRFSRQYLRRSDRESTLPFAVDWVSAACMMFRRSLVEQTGYWDEAFGGYWVDADWCRRAHAAGLIYCEPAARVTHVEQNRRERKKEVARIVQFHAGANRLYRKHFTAGYLDPRAWVTSVALAARATVLIAVNALRRGEPRGPAAATAGRPDTPKSIRERGIDPV
jgi:N-acetylglucosaminyl-diphospho-decaprenol L-rhamnosyltransferase